MGIRDWVSEFDGTVLLHHAGNRDQLAEVASGIPFPRIRSPVVRLV
jgi:hypothetical protein